MIYRLAPMSPLILVLTLVLLTLPLAFLVSTAMGRATLVTPGVLLLGSYAWVWLRFRPNRFVIRPRTLEIVWPMKRYQIPRTSISEVRLLSRADLQQKTGPALRVGAGGLWGGFGWLWTTRRGLVQMYVSRTDGLVWIERPGERPWLITPEQPEAFVRALSP